MSKYIGITIGPIVDTLSKAKQTGQLWGSSYIFSYIMKKLIEELLEKNIEKENFILPSTYLLSDNIIEEEKEQLKGVGLYPDRIIFESEEGQYELVEEAVETVLNKLSTDIAKELKKDEEKVKEFIHGYIQISYIETEVDDITKVISEVSTLLNIIELQNKTLPYEDENFILELIRNKNIKESFLAEDSYGEEKIKEFKTISEIALGEITGQARKIIKEVDGDISDKTYSEIESKLNIKLKKNSKYIAVVQSDGDNVGKIIANLKSKEELQVFSKKLFEYAKEANEEIKKYGGVTIYAGGDDLLFFAPVLCKQYSLSENNEEIKSIFDLLVKLDEVFKTKFDDEINKIKEQNTHTKNKDKKALPGLSFGVSISYKSYPLKESMDTAIGNLFGEAKKYKCRNGMDTIEKNAISLKVLKHSGQEFNFVTNLESESLKIFREMINNCIAENVVNSILDKVRRDKKIIQTIAHDKHHVDSYVENVIREEYKDLAPKYFLNLKELINKTYVEVYGDDPKEDSKDEDYFSKLTSYLKFITFIQERGN